MFDCLFCSTTFTRKDNLKRHQISNKCSLVNIDSGEKLYNLQEKLSNKIVQIGSNNKTNIINGNVNIINLNVIINPVSNLNTKYIEPSRMKALVQKFDYPSFNYLISDYIKDIISNKDHPENHSVKYIKVKPPMFSNTINQDGKIVNVIKNLKDSCELLSEPVLHELKKKLKECNKVYKNDEDFQDLYEDTVRDINRELNKESVKKALSTVLQTDILNDIAMKVNVIKNE